MNPSTGTEHENQTVLNNNELLHNGANGATETYTNGTTNTQIGLATQPQGQVTTQYGKQPTRWQHPETARIYTPAVDIYETDESLVLVANMPGVDEQSVDVTLDRNVLTIYGRVQPYLPQGYSLLYAEYGVGDYRRSFTINNQIDWEHIEGKMDNGVLTLTLPKAEFARTRKINIKS
jgi:HSP20 family molecular chaperone IbpA